MNSLVLMLGDLIKYPGVTDMDGGPAIGGRLEMATTKYVVGATDTDKFGSCENTCETKKCNLYKNPFRPDKQTCCQTCPTTGLHTQECVDRQLGFWTQGLKFGDLKPADASESPVCSGRQPFDNGLHVDIIEEMIASANIAAEELPWLCRSGNLRGHLEERLTSLPEHPRLRRHPPSQRCHRRVSRGRRIGRDPESGPQPNDTQIVHDT